jgi:hypothetical protein
LAFALPWGAYAVFGRTALPWLVEGSPTGGEVLAVAVRFMDALAIFFVFDFAINYLSALLRAAMEQKYLLKVTAAVAAGFGVLILALPLPADVTYLMGAFIAAQAVWALLLLVRVIKRWPTIASRDLPAASPPWCPRPAVRGAKSCTRAVIAGDERRPLGHVCGREDASAKAPGDREVQGKQPVDHLVSRTNRAAGQAGGDNQRAGDDRSRPRSAPIGKAKIPTAEQQIMNTLDPTAGQLPPTLRALAMGLVAETVVPVPNKLRPDSPVPSGHDETGADGRAAALRDLRWKCDELMALVLRADDPEKAAAYVLRYLPKHFDHVFDLLCGRGGSECLKAAGAEAAFPATPELGSRPRS